MTRFLFILPLLPFSSLGQDIIFFTNGQDVNAKVIEIGDDEIRYKPWDNLDGPVIKTDRKMVRSIRYQNGNKDAFYEEVFTNVSRMPEPSFDMASYLRENLRYPSAAKRKGIQGKVTVKFVVDEFGNLQNIKTINKPVGYGLEEEAVRVVKGMPAWSPGKIDGKPVKVWFSQVINFRIANK